MKHRGEKNKIFKPHEDQTYLTLYFNIIWIETGLHVWNAKIKLTKLSKGDQRMGDINNQRYAATKLSPCPL